MRVAGWGLGLVLVLAACGGGATDERSTAAAVDPNEAAYLAVVEGDVKVRKADGSEVPAAAEMVLARADMLVTGKDGRVVVVLHNRHVLKLGTSLSKRVDTLAHFDDPPPSQDLAELFAEALGADYERLGGKDRLERIAGWNARRAAGETPAPVMRREPPPPPLAEAPAPITANGGAELEKKADGGSIGLGDPGTIGHGAPPGNSAPETDTRTASGDKGKKVHERREEGVDDAPEPSRPAKPPVGNSQPAPPSRSPTDANAGADANAGDSPGVETPAAPELAEQWTLDTGSNGQVAQTRLPDALAKRRAALARCIADAGQRELTLRVEGGKIVSAKFGAAKASCAGELIGVALAGVGDAATVIVRLRN